MDKIPHGDDDPISRLYAHYFLQADILFRYHKKLDSERDRTGRLSAKKGSDEFQLHKLWLASLYVLAEGFESPLIQKALTRWKEMSLDIRVHCDSIEHKMKQLGDELRVFRNATFHYQSGPEKHLKFIQVQSRHEPLFWAEELHREFEKLFSQYRVLHFTEFAIQEDRTTAG
jgi:hypothetical protein